MKLFKTDIEKQRDRRDALTADLARAEQAIVEKREAADLLVAEGADAKARKQAVDDIVHAKEDHAVLSGSLARVNQQIATLEREIAEAADRKMRGETAAIIVKMAEDLAIASEKMASAMAEVGEAAAVIAGRFQEHGQFLAVMKSLHVELPLTVNQTVVELRARAAAVVAGHGSGVLPQLPQPVQQPAPKPDMVSLCSVKNVCWQTVDGSIKTAHAGYRIDLLPAVAAAALKHGDCVRLDDPRAKYHSDQRKVTVPEIHNCTPLDDAARRAIASAEPRGVVEPIRRSAPPGIADASRPLQQAASRALPLPPGFEPLDRGPSYTLKTPAGNPSPGQEGNDDES
jgi:hypothetical protein